MTLNILSRNTKMVQKPSVTYQFLAVFLVNILTLLYGVSRGYTSTSNPILLSDETPLPSGKISNDEASLNAAMTCPGGLFGNFFAGYIANRFGRKIPLIFLAIPTTIGWLLVLFAQNVYYLYLSRIFVGFAGGCIYVIIPLFASEIANDNVRGILGSILAFTANMGILCVNTLGNYFDYFVTPKFVITMSIICATLFTFFPESPLFLMKQGKLREAKKSIRFYQNIRGNDRESKLIEAELELMNKLKVSIEKSEKSENNSFNWSDLTRNPGKKALMIGLGLALLNPLSGVSTLLCFTSNVFEDSGSTLSPNSSAIVVAGILIVGSIIAGNLVDRVGRRFLYTVSTIGSALGYSTLATYMMLKKMGYEVEAFNWIPIASFSFALFAASWGILTLPFVVISEIIPEHLKDFCTSICLSLIWITAFMLTKFFNVLTDTIGFHGIMYFFSFVCSISAIIIILFLPETKGKSYQEIMKMLR